MAQNFFIYTLFGKTGTKSHKIAINILYLLMAKLITKLNQLLSPSSYLIQRWQK